PEQLKVDEGPPVAQELAEGAHRLGQLVVEGGRVVSRLLLLEIEDGDDDACGADAPARERLIDRAGRGGAYAQQAAARLEDPLESSPREDPFSILLGRQLRVRLVGDG